MRQEKTNIKLTVNGTEHEVEVSPDTSLADILCYDLGLTGTKIGCGDGLCGSCVILLDGKARLTDDYTLPSMLHGATLRAEHPRARILSSDTTKAAALLCNAIYEATGVRVYRLPLKAEEIREPGTK